MKNRAKSKELYFILLRYLVLLILGLFSLKIIYFVFTPLTVYPSYWLIKLFDSTTQLLSNNTIYFSNVYLSIIPACVGGAAYYLLLILNLSTPMEVKIRAKSLTLIIFSFLVLNIIRIVALSNIFSNGFKYFDAVHSLLWNFGSTVMIVLIWFVSIKLFKISETPVYSDFIKIKSYINAGKKTKSVRN